jgi:hypothetical protein
MECSSFGEGCAYRLDQHPFETQFAEELFEHLSLVLLAESVAGMAVAAWLLRSSTPFTILPNTATPGQ